MIADYYCDDGLVSLEASPYLSVPLETVISQSYPSHSVYDDIILASEEGT